MMLSIKSQSEAPVLINTRTNEKEECSWDKIFDELDYLIKYPDDTPDPEKDYRETFGHAPQKEEKKLSAVTVSEKAKPKTDKKPQKEEQKSEKAEEAPKADELPFPDGEEPKIAHVTPEDPLPEEAAVEEETSAAGEEHEEVPEAAGVKEEIAPAQQEEKELTSFQKQVIGKLQLIKGIITGMETTKENWDKVNDMLRETIILINKSTF